MQQQGCASFVRGVLRQGLAFFGYGLYLGFLFQGGGYLIFFKAFILPAVLVFRTVKAAVVAGPRRAQEPAVAPGSPGGPGAARQA